MRGDLRMPCDSEEGDCSENCFPEACLSACAQVALLLSQHKKPEVRQEALLLLVDGLGG